MARISPTPGLGAYTGYSAAAAAGRALWFSGFQASMNITNTWHRQRGGRGGGLLRTRHILYVCPIANMVGAILQF
jgi:hypothetical protein